MKTLEEIRKDMHEIQNYYLYKKELSHCENFIEEHYVAKLVKKYNAAMRKAPIKMCVLYYYLCIQSMTQAAVGEKFGYSQEHICYLVKKLQLFLQSTLDEAE